LAAGELGRYVLKTKLTAILQEVLIMQIQKSVSFQEALDIIESFPDYQQQDLIDIVRNRLIEKGRETIAENIKEAREEYSRGEVKKGSVDDIMKEIAP
jgi:uncharacterized protein YeeX (DUF496 family)